MDDAPRRGRYQEIGRNRFVYGADRTRDSLSLFLSPYFASNRSPPLDPRQIRCGDPRIHDGDGISCLIPVLRNRGVYPREEKRG